MSDLGPDLRVAIVGGGIGGLTLACCLRQRGIAFEGVEITPAFAPVGAGIGLGANAMAVLRKLGVGAAVEANGSVIHRGCMADLNGRVLTESDLDLLTGRFGSSVAVHRADLHEALIGGLGPMGFRLGVTADAIDDRGESVFVRFSDGTTERFDVVIGADGIASAVRENAVAPRQRLYSGYTCWRLSVDFDADGLPGLCEMWGRGKRFGIAPIGRGRVYCFAVENAPRGREDAEAGRASRLRERFRDFASPAGEILARTTDADIYHDDIEELAEGPWVNGRVALLGDAAHALTPNMGQGAAMAIEDAWVLAERLASASSVPEALATYEALRRPRVTWIQRRSRSLGRIAQLGARPLCALRNSLARMAPAGAAQKALVSLLETSPVIVSGQ